MIDTLLLDVDGVLQFPDPAFTTQIERDFRWRDGFAAFQAELMADPQEHQALLGLTDLLEVIDRLLPAHTSGLSAQEFLHRWLTGNIVLNQRLLDLLPHLRVAQVYLATNQDPRRGAHIQRLYQGRPGITGILISHELGAAKPDPAFFDTALHYARRDPGECLFVDDTPGYLAGAAGLGINTLRFENTGQLFADLTARGLLSPPAAADA